MMCCPKSQKRQLLCRLVHREFERQFARYGIGQTRTHTSSLATAPGLSNAHFRWLAAKVSGQVMSQTRQRPLAHGRTVWPSGRFPSSLHNEAVSNNAGTFADTNALLIKSLMALCRMWRPADLWQGSPCVDLSTRAPQTHVWGTHVLAPIRRATARRGDVSSRRVPTAYHCNCILFCFIQIFRDSDHHSQRQC